MRPAERARCAANLANLSTPAGLLVAAAGGARARRAGRGLLVAHGYRLPVPAAAAFTVGNVVILRAGLVPGRDPIGAIPPRLLRHEERHATQYALCGGIVMPLLYLGAAGWSWLRTGDFHSRNAFERRAGLADGGYREAAVRPVRDALRAAPRAGRGTAWDSGGPARPHAQSGAMARRGARM